MKQRILIVLYAGGLSMLVGCTTPSGMNLGGPREEPPQSGVVSPVPGPEHDRQTAATVSSRGRALWTRDVAMENRGRQSEAGSTLRFR